MGKELLCKYTQTHANVEVRSDIFQNFYYSQEDYALVSLCSFGNSQKLTKCNLFEKEAFAFGKEKCFTFLGSTSSSEHHQRKVGPNNGLNFLVSFRIPSQRQKGPKMQKNLTPLKLIVHEPCSKYF